MQTDNKDPNESYIRALKTNGTNNGKLILEQRPRSSGFQLFLNWFKKLETSQKFDEDDNSSEISSLSGNENDDSKSSTSSTATVESFAFLPANVYRPYGDACQPEKYITPGPYTDTYHRLIKERNRRRHLDKNLSLRKKYSLYSSGTINTKAEQIAKKLHVSEEIKVYDTFSLPIAIVKQGTNHFETNIDARKTASLSTKGNKTPCHVKGKRKAPLPPVNIETNKTSRKKRRAPAPPCSIQTKIDTKIINTPSVDNKEESSNIINNYSSNMPNFKCDISPKPWFKRQSNESKVKQKSDAKKKGKHEFPEVGFFRCSRIFDNKKQSDNNEGKNEKRISCFLPNISELDREAVEILKHKRELENQANNSSTSSDKFSKPSSARDLINKFNALTNKQCTEKGEKNESPLGIASRKSIAPTKASISPDVDSQKGNEGIPFTNSAPEIKCIACSQVKSKANHICLDFNGEEYSGNLATPQTPKRSNLPNTDPSTSFQAEVFSALPNFNYPFSNEFEIKSNDFCKPHTTTTITNDVDEKAKLKEMLKEMKNSLPKRSKPTKGNDDKTIVTSENDSKQEIIISESNKAIESTVKNVVKTKSIFDTNQINNIAEKYTEKPTAELNNKENTINQKLKPEQNIRSRDINKVTSSSQTNCSVKNSDSNMDSGKNIHLNNKNVLQDNIVSPSDNKSKTPNNLYVNIAENEKQINSNIQLVLKQLEGAISTGNQIIAAKLAQDLALLKVKCSVTTNLIDSASQNTNKSVQIYIEDQFSHQGPIPMNVNENIKIAELKKKVFDELNIPTGVQKWIINKQLAISEDFTLKQYNDENFNEPLFLYVVSPDNKKPILATKGSASSEEAGKSKQGNNNYTDNIITDSKIISTNPYTPATTKSNILKLGENSKTKEEKVASTSKQSAPIKSPRGILNNVNKKTWVCGDCTLINSLHSPICSACGTKKSNSPEIKMNTDTVKADEKTNEHYLQLINLDNSGLVPNREEFECPVCITNCERNDGVVLRDCLHTFCKECLANVVKYSEEVEIKCPYRDKDYFCDSVLQEREIKALVNKTTFEKHLAKSVSVAENKLQNAFHCKTPNCKGWCIFEENVNEFNCPICKRKNCLTCQAIHEDKNCKEYQQTINNADENSSGEVQRTKKMLEEMVSRGEAMACPSCQVVLMKKWGCDWVKCSMCKTEICWVTRGARWGPAGKGDISGGCQCGVNGIKCHPKCNYCH